MASASVLPLRSDPRVSLAKGDLTRQAIVDAAYDMAGELGLESLTIGSVALRTHRSKSGVFAHFGSRDELIKAVIDEAVNRVKAEVMVPALREPRGVRRLRAIFSNWVRWMTSRSAGCVLLAASMEYDDRPGGIRDALVVHLKGLRGSVVRAVRLAMDTGELRPDSDPEQVGFELYGACMMAQHDFRLLGDNDAAARAMRVFDRVIAYHAA